MTLLRAFGPQVPRPPLAEAMRAALGAAFGLGVAALVLAVLPGGLAATLIAPFGATAFLVFAVPNSPLAQPWSAVIGNGLAALITVAVLRLVPHPLAAALISVAGAMLAMAAFRALHPPAGAVALFLSLAADPAAPLSPLVALSPVVLGTALIVAAGILWNRLTGRVYPFRQPAPTGPHGTADPTAERRLALLPADLQAILDRLRLAPNLGAEDLGRALEAAEAEATARHLGDLSAADVMSRDLVTVLPETPLPDVAAAFLRHRFNTLPVRTSDGAYAGLLTDRDLIGAAPDRRAADLARPAETLPPAAGLAELLPLLSDGHQQSVPIVDPASGQLVGLVTRTDLIALLSRKLRGPTAAPAP